ncbi:MAG: signal peptidase I [Gemmataceae bacterium]
MSSTQRICGTSFTFLTLLLLTRVLIIEAFHVTSNSMTPRYPPGARIWVDKAAFEFRSPRRWEVVVFNGPTDERFPFVKRIVGLPGEMIQIKDGEVYVDGELATKPVEIIHDVHYQASGRHGIHSAYRLGDDEYFMLGDNSEASDDSRFWPHPGVKHSALIGPVLFPSESPPGG